MWSSRLFWKLFLVVAGLNLALTLGFLLVASGWQKAQIFEQVEERLRATATVLRSHVKDRIATASTDELQALLKNLAAQTDIRITLVDAQGVVLADSEEDPARMENHQGRPELRQAAVAGLGTDQRVSSTLGIRMFYLAIPIGDAGVTTAFVRVAVVVESIDAQVTAIRWLLGAFALGVGSLAVVLSYVFVGRIIRPLGELTRGARAVAAGNFEDPVPVDSADELGTLADAFNRMRDELANRVGQLRENSERLQTVLGSMIEGVIVVDADKRVLLANAASRKMLEFATDVGRRRPLGEVVRCRPLHDATTEALNSEGPYEAEFEVTYGEHRHLALRARRLTGEPCPGAVVVLHDVTELRRLEAVRRDFVANVSHELKTPLSSIKAYAETLRLGAIADPDHNVEFVRRIEQQAARLHQLIIDLLSLARVESGGHALEVVDVAMADVVDACVRRHAEAAAALRVELTVEAPDIPAAVRADQEGLRTILDNLVDNAIKYNRVEGQVVVRWSADDDGATIEVHDTGVGIAPQDQQRVFERFYRVDKARSNQMPGSTGLGLAIVKHLVQASGGSVALTSRLGQGTTIQVRLPTSVETAARDDRTAR